MKTWVKVLLIIGGIGLVAAAGVVYYVYNKPHRDVSSEKGVQLSAQNLYEAYHANEANGEKLYTNKALEVTGEVADVSTNQDGKTVVNFKTSDPLVMINCTFRDNPGGLKPGQTITFKGICTGYITDMNVVINEGILVKK
jgi:hypothetical protein